MKAVFDALNVAYGEEEKRSFIALNLRSLAFTLGIILFILVAVGAIVVIGSNVVAWVLGAIFSPDKSGGKSLAWTAIGLFCLPGFFFLAYVVFRYTVITRDPVHPRAIHLVGIESPGLTSAPAIARYVVPLVTETLD